MRSIKLIATGLTVVILDGGEQPGEKTGRCLLLSLSVLFEARGGEEEK
jgi:hypothetical protein